jgi:hypothetical protein
MQKETLMCANFSNTSILWQIALLCHWYCSRKHFLLCQYFSALLLSHENLLVWHAGHCPRLWGSMCWRSSLLGQRVVQWRRHLLVPEQDIKDFWKLDHSDFDATFCIPSVLGNFYSDIYCMLKFWMLNSAILWKSKSYGILFSDWMPGLWWLFSCVWFCWKFSFQTTSVRHV